MGAVHHERDFFGAEINPRYIEPDGAGLGSALQLREMRAVMRLGPRLDRALVDRLLLIRHDQLQVQLDNVAEAMAGRAGAEWVVERKQARLRIFVWDPAGPALETLREQMLDGGGSFGKLNRPRCSAAFRIGRFDRIGNASP